MNEQLTLKECKMLWIFGALERLQSLGFMNGPMYRVAPKAIDLFVEIDESRDFLFQTDEEVLDLFKLVVKMESEEEPDEIEMNQLCELLLEYKNNRDVMMKFALEHSYS